MELLRIRDAALKYSVSEWTLYKWHRQGKYPALFAKLGNVLFLDEAELGRLIENYKNGELKSNAQGA